MQRLPEVAMLTEQLGEAEELLMVPNEGLIAHALISRAEALPMVWRLTAALSSAITAGLENPQWCRLVRGAVRVLRANDRHPCYRTIVVLSAPIQGTRA